MPRAHRFHLDGQVCHITDRRHRARYRRIEDVDGTSVLREASARYRPRSDPEIRAWIRDETM